MELHASLLSNAGFLTIGMTASAVLGFLFWWCAARALPPETQGLAAAAISAMNLLAFIGEFGFHTLLMGHALNSGRDARLISAAMISSVVLTVLLCCAFLATSSTFAPQLQTVVGSDMGRSLFLLGAGATALVVTVDGATIGLGAGSVRMWREFVFSILRLVFLFLLLHFAVGAPAASILLVWIAALILSLVFVAAVAIKYHIFPGRPDFTLLTPLMPDVGGHHLLNLGALGPTIALPFLVAEVLSPTINAVFYATWMLLQAFLLAPAAIAMALFAVGSTDPGGIATRLRFSLQLSSLIGLGAGLGCYLFLDDVLALFNPVYPLIGGASLKYIGFSMFALMVKYHYIAVMRLRKQMLKAAIVLGWGAILELCGAAGGGIVAGLPGLILMWMVAVFLQAAVLLPTILAATGSSNWIVTRLATHIMRQANEGRDAK